MRSGPQVIDPIQRSADAPEISLVEIRQSAHVVRHGLAAGLIAAATLAAEEIVATVLLGGRPSDPFRLIASAIFGQQTFSAQFPLVPAVAVGGLIHILLSLLFGVIFVWIVAFFYQLSARWPLLPLYGVLYGLALWELNILTVLHLVFPGIADQFGLANQIWNGLVSYAVFYGLVLGLYLVRVRPGVVGDWKAG